MIGHQIRSFSLQKITINTATLNKMQFMKASTIVLLEIIFQCATALNIAACAIKCKHYHGRQHCMNPCFTPGEYAYKVIQSHLITPCTDEARYWRSYYKSTGMAVPASQKCFSTLSQVQPSSDCITAGELKDMEPMARCKVLKYDAQCQNVIEFLSAHELAQLTKDAQLNC